MSPKDFVEKSEWIKGPDFLREPKVSRLKEENYEDHVVPDFPEVKKLSVNTSTVKESFDIVSRPSRFSSWQKAKIAVALCLRYKRKLRNKVVSKEKEPSYGTFEHGSTKDNSANTGPSVVDLEEAEVEIIKQLQRDAFPSEIKGLQNIQANAHYGSRALDKEKKTVLMKTRSLHTLDPFLDRDGIIRIGGRIRKADLSEA